MDLYKEILISILKKEEVNVVFPGIKAGVAEMVEMKSYMALQKIKAIIENDSFSDFECVEEIVCVFEEIGSGGGGRHDFG